MNTFLIYLDYNRALALPTDMLDARFSEVLSNATLVDVDYHGNVTNISKERVKCYLTNIDLTALPEQAPTTDES